MSNNKILLGRRIKELRKELGLTQEKLAELIFLETSTLSGIESGRHFPSLITLEKIANVLKIDLKNIFDYKHLEDKQQKKDFIIENIENLDEDKLSFIYEFVEKYKYIIKDN